ncbi:hypothetical protein RAMDARK_1543 [Rickettsia amblyommatis str. Darkwater]|nr:hypothetical protein RAMDARK_1543 [Rickettsia amblyommatis str. Darkwater]
MSILGKSVKLIPGFTTLFGSAKVKALTRADYTGSVKIFKPSI